MGVVLCTVQDDSENSRSPFSPFMQRLSSRPVLVTVVSFALTLVLTVVVLFVEPDSVDILGVVSLAATIWGLTLALVIYLLTAQDTDRVLDHISDLQEQLAASLEEPADEEEMEQSADTTPEPAAEVVPPRKAELDPEPRTRPTPSEAMQALQDAKHKTSHAPRQRGGGPGGHGDRGVFYTPESGIKLEDVAPSDYLKAWEKTTGRDASQIFRAWTRSREGSSPWVFMLRDGSRWSVFASDDGAPSVIDLSEMRWGRGGNRGTRGRRPNQPRQGN
ncbi:hypothetical protein G7068_01515 [Leucobacter viscericola]|uniref:Uncharacterized protein n=1 Tax=Leucobacter viscericola TaxID=2714935 RepID=A0A6G7XC98_9MICO|nr:hypothetical protein [Leucobacter viscericola]QIK62027.1 hypothetical protein G7068_01515 [Leucobacter viscericola]